MGHLHFFGGGGGPPQGILIPPIREPVEGEMLNAAGFEVGVPIPAGVNKVYRVYMQEMSVENDTANEYSSSLRLSGWTRDKNGVLDREAAETVVWLIGGGGTFSQFDIDGADAMKAIWIARENPWQVYYRIMLLCWDAPFDIVAFSPP